MQKKVLAFLSFFLPLAIYVKTLCPTVLFGDSGELITAAVSLGIPHPPGFPLWVILSHLFTYLPINSPAWRVNFSSAVFASACIFLLFIIIADLLHRFFKSSPWSDWLAFVAALALAFTGDFWVEGVAVEVYVLYDLLSLLIFYSIYRLEVTPKLIWLYLSIFFSGLILGTHYLALGFFPLVLIYLSIFHRPLFWQKKVVLLSLGFFLLSLSVFLLLPLRSKANPVIDWGNPENLTNFKAVVTREQFSHGDKVHVAGISLPVASLKPGNSPLDIVVKGTHYSLLGISSNLTWVILPFLLLGWWPLWQKSRRLALLTFCFWGYTGPFLASAFGAYPYPEVDYSSILPSILILALPLGFGLMFFWQRFNASRSSLFSSLLAVSFLVLPLILVLNNYKDLDFSKMTIARDHALNILETVEPNSLIFAEENEWLFPLLYINRIEKVRPDVNIYDRNGNLFQDIYAEAKKDYRSENYFEARRKALEKNLVLATGRPAYYAVDKSFENYRYDDTPKEGILYRLGQANDVNFGEKYNNILSRENAPYYWGTGTAYILAYYHIQYGDYLKSKADENGALSEYEKAAIFGRYDTRVINNLAILFDQLGKRERAEALLRESIKLKNRNNEVAYNNLGTLLESRGEVEEAEKNYAEAVKQQANYLPALFNLASLYEKQGKYEESLALFREAQALNPADRSLQGKVSALEKASTAGSTFEKDFAAALAQAKAGDCAKALKTFEDLFSKQPQNTKVLNNIGVCQAQLGNFSDARLTWEKVLKMDPENTNAKENLSLLEKR